MDTSHDNVYDMNGENNNPGGLNEERIRLIYQTVSDVKHLQNDVDNLKGVENSMVGVKNDMVIMNKGVHADMASLKSSFTAKLDATTANIDLQMTGLKASIKQTQKSIDESNSRQKWVRNLLFTILLAIPGTLLIGMTITNRTQNTRIQSYQKNQDKKMELFIKEIKASIEGIKESIQK